MRLICLECKYRGALKFNFKILNGNLHFLLILVADIKIYLKCYIKLFLNNLFLYIFFYKIKMRGTTIKGLDFDKCYQGICMTLNNIP